MILGWCRHWSRQHADADDVVQNVLLVLSRQMREFASDASGSFCARLKTIAHRAWLNYIGQRRKHDTAVAGEDTIWGQLTDPPRRKKT
jgi:DNA-directed RNA polymerase specialized sigma24 family protein